MSKGKMRYMPHRGLLADALAEVVEIEHSEAALQALIESIYGPNVGRVVVRYDRFDPRCGWDRWGVLMHDGCTAAGTVDRNPADFGNPQRSTCSGEWVAHRKGDYKGMFEVAVVRADNDHGFRSYGWYGPDKWLVAQGIPDGTTKAIWDGLWELAQQVAGQMNSRMTDEL